MGTDSLHPNLSVYELRSLFTGKTRQTEILALNGWLPLALTVFDLLEEVEARSRNRRRAPARGTPASSGGGDRRTGPMRRNPRRAVRDNPPY